MDTKDHADQAEQLSSSPDSTSSSAHRQRRRERRPLPRVSKTNPLVGLVNVTILVIGLTVILASRCDQSSPSVDQKGWLDHLVVPRDLHLPDSVIDRKLREKVPSKASDHNQSLKQ